MADRKSIFLGYFKNEIDAAKSYDNAAKTYHGDFAVLNFESSIENRKTCPELVEGL
jgi:hypothetical protein